MFRDAVRRWLVGPFASTVFEAEDRVLPSVNAANALRWTPVYRAVTLIASDIARLEMTIDGSQAASLMENPSTVMGSFDLRRSMTMQLLMYGNAFAAINRTRGGELLELLPLDPDSVSLDVTKDRPFYKTRQYGDLQMEDVFHLRAPGTSGLWGDSPIHLCRTSLQIMAAQEQMALEAYRNGGNPKIAITGPQKFVPEQAQKIEDYYMKRHAGSVNAGRPLVLLEGMKVERISSTIDDTGLDAARRHSVADVCRIFGVPSSYLSEDTGSAYGTMEWLSRMYVQALEPWCATWSSEIRSKLGARSVAWDTDDIVRPGLAETMAAYRTAVEAGLMTRNEVREELDLEPLPGLDVPTLALNLGAGGGASNAGSDTSAEAGTPNDF